MKIISTASSGTVGVTRHQSEATDPPMSDGRKQELLAFWKRCLANQVVPQPIPVLAEIEEAIASLEKEKDVRLSDMATWRLRLNQYCERYHPGREVVWFETEAGPAVLAVGLEEVALFRQHFLDALNTRAKILYPPSLSDAKT